MSFLLNKIQIYKKKSIEEALKEVMKSKNRIIAGKFSPIVFDMQYEEIEYSSTDNIKLFGWLIKNEGATKTLIFLHGRLNNRIFCIKFLQLFKDMNLNEKYNIFIPDLRNSGKSTSSKTAFGYFFAKDIYATMLMLNERYEYNNFILYGFSQGAMGSAIACKLYEDKLKEKNIKIEKMILDSPVSNIKKIILENAKLFNIKIPPIFFIYAFYRLNKIVDNMLNELCLSKLLGVVPTLILQSEKDTATPFHVIEKEYEELKNREKNEKIEKTKIKVFRKGLHVRMYLEYKNEYTQVINNFLESENI